MTSATSTSFYEERRLSTPSAEYRPQRPDELCEVLDELETDDKPWRLIGDGQHILDDVDDTTVVRTDGVDALVDLDAESGLVRVEAGMSWKLLRRHLAEEGFSLQRYGLHPASATVGGLLARRRSSPPLLRGGDLLDGCVSLSAHDVELGDYRYLVAPRKASGPDLRYEYLGNEGRRGAILDVTLVVWRPVAQKLLRYDDCPPTEAAQIVEALYSVDSVPSWIHYRWPANTLQFAITAPGQLLRSRVKWLSDQVRRADEVEDTEVAQKRRHWLEARHPDRRSQPRASRTRRVQIAPADLRDDLTEVFGDDVEEVEITSWTPRRVTAFVRWSERKLCESG